MSYYLVVGLGQTGLSCVRYLHQQGHEVVVTDTRDTPPGASELAQAFPDVATRFGGFTADVFMQAQCLVTSPGVPISTPIIQKCQQQGVPVMGDIQLFAQAVSQPIIAITGTNGKSTVTSLVGEMLKQQGVAAVVAGNIGQPVLDVIDECAECYVLELSSFQLETTTQLGAEIACILNVSPDHLDRYASYEDYVNAKKRIYQGAKHIVRNLDDRATFPLEHVPSIDFSLDANQSADWTVVTTNQQPMLMYGERTVFSLNDMRIKGKQNWQNALAACAMAHLYGVSFAAITETLTTFSGLRHRCEWLRELAGVDWYNDSKGTNVGASLAAIEGIGATRQGQLVLLLGGQGKGGDFASMNTAVSRYVKAAVIFGEDADLIDEQLDFPDKYRVNSLDEAVATSQRLARAGDAVLFSPACASFDMYQNYEARGEHFARLVGELV